METPRFLIVSFLQKSSTAPYCAPCLAAWLGADLQASVDAIISLSEEPGYRLEWQRCLSCGRRAETLTYDGLASSPRCHLCGNVIASEADTVFAAEELRLHRSCFLLAMKRSLEPGS